MALLRKEGNAGIRGDSDDDNSVSGRPHCLGVADCNLLHE